MPRRPALAALLALAALAGAGCRKSNPLAPAKPVPVGTVLFKFTRKVRGPVELTLDGTRVPVQQDAKGGRFLALKGLSAGKHRYFLSSPHDAFGPDAGEVEVTPDKGTYQVVLAQRFKAVLYGQAPVAPAAEGLPGVTATLTR